MASQSKPQANNIFKESTKLRIRLWNVRSVEKRKEELQSMLSNLDILICVESWLKPTKDINFPKFNTIRVDRADTRGGGIVVFVAKHLKIDSIKCDSIKKINSLESLTFKVTNVNPATSFIVIYKIPSIKITQQEWDTLFALAELYSPSLVLGDFDAHNEIWNCDSTDLTGEHSQESSGTHNFFPDKS